MESMENSEINFTNDRFRLDSAPIFHRLIPNKFDILLRQIRMILRLRVHRAWASMGISLAGIEWHK